MTLPPGLFDRPADGHDGHDGRPGSDSPAVAEMRAREIAEQSLTAAVHDLIDVTVRTSVPVAELTEAAARVRDLTQALAADAVDGSLGLRTLSDGRRHDAGNPMVGLRNPMAPPLRLARDAESLTTSAQFNLGAPSKDHRPASTAA